jgi:hypothetical protein
MTDYTGYIPTLIGFASIAFLTAMVCIFRRIEPIAAAVLLGMTLAFTLLFFVALAQYLKSTP